MFGPEADFYIDRALVKVFYKYFSRRVMKDPVVFTKDLHDRCFHLFQVTSKSHPQR